MEKGFQTYLRAGYPAIWVQTHEECRAISSLARDASGYKIFSWDMIGGLKDHTTGKTTPLSDPLKALNTISSFPTDTVFFLKDFQKFIGAIEISRTIKTLLPNLKANGKHFIFVSPVCNIPVELEKDLIVYPFSLPSIDDLFKIAKKLVAENNLDIDVDQEIIAASKGMTVAEAENAMALSLVQEKTLSKKILEKEKLQTIRKSGMMELYEAVPEKELGGLKNLKRYIHNRKKGFSNPNIPSPKGILLVGLPGAGKSLSAKVIASVLDYPLIRLDISALKGSLVGESERKMREALSLIDAVSPCVVWIDEIEKSLGGVQSSNRTDGGTTSAMFGYLLTWMQESKTAKYIVATCNDIGDLLTISQGALLRRFDDIFFVDLPNENEREEILKIMNVRYKTRIDSKLSQKMDNWTGAEIEKFIVASIYDGTEEALQNVKPIFLQNRDLIEKAREWANYNARLANEKNENESSNERRIK